MTETPIKPVLLVCAIILTFAAQVPRLTMAQQSLNLDTGLENQLGLTFSPDGSMAFWVAWNGSWGSNDGSREMIYTSQRKNDDWSVPSRVEIPGDHSNSDPSVSPDGLWLYFVSDRPTSDDDESNDGNIWRYSLVEENRLEYLSINSKAAEYSPVVTATGALYFASDRDGGFGEGDLYRAARMGDGFGAPQNLGTAFNTPTGEWNIWVSADESEIIFEASSRETNVSVAGDLYYTWRTPAGWSSALPIVQLNSGSSDLMPRLHPDGETLYYTSAPIGGHARIEAVEWKSLREELRSQFRTKVANPHNISYP